MIGAHTCDLPGRRLEWKQDLGVTSLRVADARPAGGPLQ